MTANQIGTYRISREIGRDLWGVVYDAESADAQYQVYIRGFNPEWSVDSRLAEGLRQVQSLEEDGLSPAKIRIKEIFHQDKLLWVITEIPVVANKKISPAESIFLPEILRILTGTSSVRNPSGTGISLEGHLDELLAWIQDNRIIPEPAAGKTLSSFLLFWLSNFWGKIVRHPILSGLLLFLAVSTAIVIFPVTRHKLVAYFPEAYRFPKLLGEIPYDTYSNDSLGAYAKNTTTVAYFTDEENGLSDDTGKTKVGSIDITIHDSKAPYATPLLPPKKSGLTDADSRNNNNANTKQVKKPGDDEATTSDVTIPPGMVYAPGGIFPIGSNTGANNEKPEHQVALDAFYIDRFEVTNTQYSDFLKATGTAYPPQWSSALPPPGQESYPITNITFSEANSYAAWAGKRLPTEAEWERAARDNTENSYPWGMDYAASRANVFDSGWGVLMPVGGFPSGISMVGCYDMCGNAAEWTADYYLPYLGNTFPDPNYGKGFIVIRGGSYLTKAINATVTARMYANPQTRYTYVGFRCVMDIAPAKSLVKNIFLSRPIRHLARL